MQRVHIVVILLRHVVIGVQVSETILHRLLSFRQSLCGGLGGPLCIPGQVAVRIFGGGRHPQDMEVLLDEVWGPPMAVAHAIIRKTSRGLGLVASMSRASGTS